MRQTIHLLTRLRRRLSDPATAGSQSGNTRSALRESQRLRSRESAFVSALICFRLLPLTGRLHSHKRSFLRESYGSSMLETAVMIPVLVLLLVGAVDYGRGFYAAIEVSSAAESAAMYGTSKPTDTAGMVSMAKLDAKDVSTLNVNAAYGCECADGTGAVVSCVSAIVCSNNAVRYVDVWTTAVYTPLLPYPAIP